MATRIPPQATRLAPERRASGSPNLAQGFGLLGASLLLSLLLGELAVRLVLPRPGFIAFPLAETRGVIVADARRGHAYAPDLSRHVVTPDYELDFATNELGLRDIPLASVPAGALPLLAVGDSYTQGHGVRAELAWPKRIEARLAGVHVFNAGVSGYGLQQMRTTAAVFVPRFGARVLFAGIYPHGHSRVTDPYVLVGDGAGLVRSSMAGRVRAEADGFWLPAFEREPLRSWGFSIDRHWYLGGHLMHALLGPRGGGGNPPAAGGDLHDDVAALARELAPFLDELERLRSDAEGWSVPLVALLINPVEPDGAISALQRGYNQVVGAFAREHGICLVDPITAFEADESGEPLRLGSDPHWSPRAHELAVGELLAALARARSGSASAETACAPAAEILLDRQRRS